MDIIRLFPRVISRDVVEKSVVLSVPSTEEYRSNAGNQSSRDKYVLNRPELSLLKSILEEKVNNHFQEVYRPDTEGLYLYITQSWFNTTEVQQYHHTHAHANSILSGVLYFEVNDSDSIRFYAEGNKSSDLILEFPTSDYTDLNSTSWTIGDLEHGSLLIFSSTLSHDVPEKGGEEEHNRVSLAFNTFVTGHIGDTDSLTELILR